MAPPRQVPVHEWADQYRVLDEFTSAEEGAWHTSRTPYLVGLWDGLTHPLVEVVAVQKSTQVGGTEAWLNWLAHAIDLDPGATMVVFPKGSIANEVSNERFQPMLRKSLRLASHLTGRADDMADDLVKLDRMPVYFEGSGSPADLATWAVRRLVMDEIDKYARWRGVEADPTRLARERTRTYVANRKILMLSSPTTRSGHIHRERCRSLSHRLWVPCPHCGRYQVLRWPQVTYPKDEDLRLRILDERHAAAELVSYSCEHCERRIEDRHKPWMLVRSAWLADARADALSQEGTTVGAVELEDTAALALLEGLKWKPHYRLEKKPKGKTRRIRTGLMQAGLPLGKATWPTGQTFIGGGVLHVDARSTTRWGFWLNCLYSPWLTFAEIAAEWLDSRHDPAERQNFINSWLGEIWEDKTDAPDLSVIRACMSPYKRGSLPVEPSEVIAITAAVDVHRDHLRYVVRAWGYEVRSWLIEYGSIVRPGGEGSDLAPLLDDLLQGEYAGRPLSLTYIDSQWDSNAVYLYCAGRSAFRIVPARGGNSRTAQPIRLTTLEHDSRGKALPRSLRLRTWNPWIFRKAVVDQMRTNEGDPGEWRIPDDAGEDYTVEVINQGVRVVKRGGRERVEWSIVDPTKGDHYFDNEVNNRAAAWELGVHRVQRRAAPKPPPGPPNPPLITRPGFRRAY